MALTGIEEEATVADIAARHQGMVTTAQLLKAGFNDGAIRRRAAGGWLVRRHQGVYQLGVFAGPYDAEVAALLACGPRAVLSHSTAAAMWRLVGEIRAAVEISIVGGDVRGRSGIRVHRAYDLEPDEVVHRNGLRVTSPPGPSWTSRPRCRPVNLTASWKRRRSGSWLQGKTCWKPSGAAPGGPASSTCAP
jgi:hypothetical protein